MGRVFGEFHIEARKQIGTRHGVVHERASLHLGTGRVVDLALDQGLAGALHDAAMHLAIDDQRVDHLAGVIQRGVAGDFQLASLRIDLQLAHRCASGISRHASDEVFGRGQRTLQFCRQQSRRRCRHGARHIPQADAAIGATHQVHTFLVAQIGRRCFQQMRCCCTPLLDHRQRGAQQQFTGDTHRTIGVRAATSLGDLCVATVKHDAVVGNAKLI